MSGAQVEIQKSEHLAKMAWLEYMRLVFRAAFPRWASVVFNYLSVQHASSLLRESSKLCNLGLERGLADIEWTLHLL